MIHGFGYRKEREGGGGGDIILVEKHQYLCPEYALMVI